jgi:class 3 adenylate cyclase/tetratricopeptide (TPR) repeat protein
LTGLNHGTSLSTREGEVARLYVDGLTYKEIARELEVSPATVRTHLNTIYRKLEVTSRIELLHRLDGNGSGPPAQVRSAQAEPVVERRQLTVMFVDLVGSTALAADMDAEDMHELLQAYRRAVRQVVEAAGGHAAGFPGDGVVVCFGWPQALEDAAERAVRAGLQVLDTITRISAPDGRPLAARAGIATGVVVVDGSKGDADSLTGGTPNLAARLQSVAEPGGLVIAAGTRELVGDLFAIEDLGPREVKGLPAPVRVFRVTGESSTASRFEARHGGSLAPMVGRDSELALLRERWDRARHGEGQAVLLTGEPGIGKSRIAAALIEAVAGDGDGPPPILLRYQTSPQQGDSPLWPVRRQLTLASGLESVSDGRARLQRLEAFLAESQPASPETVTLLAELLDIETTTPLPAMSAERRRERIIEMLTERLLALARQAPVLLLFEDLHWIDPSSLELIERIIGRTGDARVMLVLTSRPEAEPHLAGHPQLTRISLSRLGRAAAMAMIERLVGEGNLDAELVSTILERTDGVPLYLEEMTAAIVETGAAAGTVPASLQDSLMARLDRLGAAKEVAQTAAVIGREFDVELLAAAAGGDAKLAEAVDRLVAAELIFRRGPRLIFKHALVQDVAYQSLLRGRRAALHARIAEVLLGRFAARATAEPQTVAHHLEEAGRSEGAADYYARAADLASYQGANREARAYLERALALIERLPIGPARDRREVEALTMLGRVVVADEGHASPGTATVYDRALRRCREAGLGLAEFPLVLGLAVNSAVAGNVKKALPLAERVAELAAGGDDAVLQVEADYVLGITHSWAGDLMPALRHFAAGINRYSPAQHARHLALYSQDPGVVCHTRRAMTLWYMGDAVEAAAGLQAAIDLARQLGHSFSINYVLNWIAVHALEAGELEAARRLTGETLAHAREQGFGVWLTMGSVTHAQLVLLCDTADAAVVECARVLARVRQTTTGVMAAQALSLLGEALRRSGRPKEGMARSAEALAVMERGGARWAKVEVLRRRAALERDLGDEAAGEATLARALAVAQRQNARLLELRVARQLATVWGERGEHRRGFNLLAPCLAGFAEGAETPDVAAARALLTTLGD